MNLKTLVKLSNIVALVSIVLLIYWVFIFVSTEVFGFKIFRENISQTFAMSVLGILALMGGSLMINVMFNLTRIAQKHNQDEVAADSKGFSKQLILAFALSFPVIFGLLFTGDYLTSVKKENMLVQSAQSIIERNAVRTDALVNYEVSDGWLAATSATLNFFEQTERNFPHVSVIVKDNVDDAPVFLAFQDYNTQKNDSGEVIEPTKRQYLMATTKPERDYLNKVFDEGFSEKRFSASDGKYELFFPYFKDGRRIVLYFSDYQRYGKMGS